ncbi:TPA: ATPase, T2SS/T4P/T4SS family [Salmonella enterica subsp. enterica serovar 6,7:y:-]
MSDQLREKNQDVGDVVPVLKQLGYQPEQIRLIQRLLYQPEGGLILSGPTGAGKSGCRVSLSDKEPSTDVSGRDDV